MNLDYPCGTCDKWRDGCDFCCGTNTGDGSREELMTDTRTSELTIAHLDHDLVAPCEIDRDAPDGTAGLFGCGGNNRADFITWPAGCCPRNHAPLLICQPCLTEILGHPDGAACLWCDQLFMPASTAFRLIEPLNRRTR